MNEPWLIQVSEANLIYFDFSGFLRVSNNTKIYYNIPITDV